MESRLEDLLALVDRISQLESQIRDFDQLTGPLRANMQILRARITLQVTSERDNKGRLLYPNEKSREAARIIVLSDNPEYQEVLRQVRELERQREKLIVEQMHLQQRHHILTLTLDTKLADSGRNAGDSTKSAA